MNGVLGRYSILKGYAGLGTTWAHEMNFMNHAPGAGLISMFNKEFNSKLVVQIV